MSSVLAIIQFVIMAYTCIYELKKKSIAVFLWAVLIVMFGITHMISVISGQYDYSTETMNKSSVFTILFTAIYLLTRIILSKQKNEPKVKENLALDEKEKKTTMKFMKLLMYILVFSIIIRCANLLRQTGGNIFNTSWETMRQTGGKYFSIAQIFMPIYLLSSSCLLMAINLKNKRSIIISTIAILFEVLISRNRIEILPLLVSYIYILILKTKKFNISKLLMLFIIGIISIYLIYALRVFRRAGTVSNFIKTYDLTTFNETVLDYFRRDDGELGLRNYMYYFIENNNNFENFGRGHTYIRMLFMFIPTKWSFNLKPPDFAISMGSAAYPRIVGLSIHPTLLGDVYANFGTYGFLWAIFWAAGITIIDRMIFRKNVILFLSLSVIWSSVYIIQARGSIYNGFTWGIYASIALNVIYSIFNWRKKGEKTNI